MVIMNIPLLIESLALFVVGGKCVLELKTGSLTSKCNMLWIRQNRRQLLDKLWLKNKAINEVNVYEI